MRSLSRFPTLLTPHRARVLDERARSMRHAPTATEARLFEALRGGRLGVGFRRQVPLVDRYIADLFAPKIRLVVEIDGGVHEKRREADARRDQALARAGLHVLRVEAKLVAENLEQAVAVVRFEVGQTSILKRPRATAPPPHTDSSETERSR